MKVFWSWQSDTPGKIGRHLIRDALREAIEDLRQPQEIEEPTARETREKLHLDHDIHGETGTPDLAATIFRKIDQSAIFIADVTLVGSTPKKGDEPSKRLINSNVAIELGYALHCLSDKRVLLVFNESYGRYEELPFDLRHKGGAVVFKLANDAGREQISAAKRSLKADFVRTLRPFIVEAERASPENAVLETPFVGSNRAAYFEQGEPLARVGVPDEDEVQFQYPTDALCYLRLIPQRRLSRPVPIAVLRQFASNAPVLNTSSSLVGINKYGAIAFDPATNPTGGTGYLSGSTQLFENGEVWCVSTKLIVTKRPAFAPDTVKVPFMHARTFERTYVTTLERLASLMPSVGAASPWIVEAGVSRTADTYLVVDDEQWGPIRKDGLFHRDVLKSGDVPHIKNLLLTFFSMVFDATGHPRPERYNGFP